MKDNIRCYIFTNYGSVIPLAAEDKTLNPLLGEWLYSVHSGYWYEGKLGRQDKRLLWILGDRSKLPKRVQLLASLIIPT